MSWPFGSRKAKTIYVAQGGRCAGCQEPKLMTELTRDHIRPRRDGGSNHISNMQLLCVACHCVKDGHDIPLVTMGGRWLA